MKKDYYSLKIPGKTFISGEYLALNGGNSLIVSTKPGFQVFFVEKPSLNSNLDGQSLINQLCKIHGLNESFFDKNFLKNNQSPAEIFYQKNLKKFHAWDIYFYDGYDKKGGFGASTAQFLALFLFELLINNEFISVKNEMKNKLVSVAEGTSNQSNLDLDLLSNIDLKELLFQYWDCQNNAESIRTEIESDLGKLFLLPSGNDLLAQKFPGFNFIGKDLSPNKFSELKIEQQNAKWPFADLGFFLAWTGNKIPTHQHLKDLQSFQSTLLNQIQHNIKESFSHGKQDDFIDNINLWFAELKKLNFVCDETLKLVEQSKKVPAIRAIKGCGALGSDVLFVLYSKSEADSVKNWLNLNSLEITYSLEDVWQESVNFERYLWD